MDVNNVKTETKAEMADVESSKVEVKCYYYCYYSCYLVLHLHETLV